MRQEGRVRTDGNDAGVLASGREERHSQRVPGAVALSGDTFDGTWRSHLPAGCRWGSISSSQSCEPVNQMVRRGPNYFATASAMRTPVAVSWANGDRRRLRESE
nr:hypothetical protein KPHV_20320 [Kitasatospora purpeofusca]